MFVPPRDDRPVPPYACSLCIVVFLLTMYNWSISLTQSLDLLYTLNILEDVISTVLCVVSRCCVYRERITPSRLAPLTVNLRNITIVKPLVNSINRTNKRKLDYTWANLANFVIWQTEQTACMIHFWQGKAKNWNQYRPRQINAWWELLIAAHAGAVYYRFDGGRCRNVEFN